MARIYPDSKTFVDMKLKQSPEKTIEIFRKWQTDYPAPTKEDVETFVNVSCVKIRNCNIDMSEYYKFLKCKKKNPKN